jgi:uncharacterized protein YjiS (DUF1127 family)
LYQYKSQEANMPQAQIKTLPYRPRISLVQHLVLALTSAAARRRNRKALAQLGPHLLRDIGLTRDEAMQECAKPFWQP